MFMRNREERLFLSVYVDDMKDVDLGEPTSLLDHVKDIVDNFRTMFEP